MGRPVKFSHDEAMHTIVQEFWTHGYEACSVKALSEKLGITRSSFYNAFGSREDVFKEAITLYMVQAPSQPLSDLHPDMTIKALVTTTYKEICRRIAADEEARGCMVVNGIAQLANVHEELGDVLTRTIFSSIDTLENTLKKAVALGELPRETDTHAIALTMQSLMFGLNIMCKVVKNEEELWLIAQTTLSGTGLLDHH